MILQPFYIARKDFCIYGYSSIPKMIVEKNDILIVVENKYIPGDVIILNFKGEKVRTSGDKWEEDILLNLREPTEDELMIKDIIE
jgi:hypothetical protein